MSALDDFRTKHRGHILKTVVKYPGSVPPTRDEVLECTTCLTGYLMKSEPTEPHEPR